MHRKIALTPSWAGQNINTHSAMKIINPACGDSGAAVYGDRTFNDFMESYTIKYRLSL